MKQVIIVFTRHELSQTQINEAWKIAAEKRCTSLADEKDCQVIYLKDLASINIETDEQLEDVANKIKNEVWKNINTEPFKRSVVLGLFGVFPAMLLERLAEEEIFHYTDLFSAWNVARTPEGGKPTFEFKRWCRLPIK